jgi:histidinol-phosphate phosphatase family protein
MKKNILICLDRDGTLIYDNKYYLGSQKNWKSLLKFLPSVTQGIKILNKIPNATIYIITNQSGVAVKSLPLLTLKRAKEVTQETINQLGRKNAHITDYLICPHAPPSYTKKRKDFKFEKKFVCACDCIKPNPGMISEALKREGFLPKDTEIYFIGNRESDVKAALNANGFGILVPFSKEPGEDIKTKKLKSKNTYIAKNFLQAARFIKKRES